MTIVYYPDLVQGSDEWLAARCGLLTASEMKLIVTPSLKVASNDRERSHLFELLAQRITKYVEPSYISDDMLRGINDEETAKLLYHKKHAKVANMGFITNDQWGFTIGFSPDGLVGEDGFIEVKSRRQKFQVETIISQEVPSEFMLQVQTGMLVTGRTWCDFISFSGGLPMVPIRVEANTEMQGAILEASTLFEDRLKERLWSYKKAVKAKSRMIKTVRKIEQEMFV